MIICVCILVTNKTQVKGKLLNCNLSSLLFLYNFLHHLSLKSTQKGTELSLRTDTSPPPSLKSASGFIQTEMSLLLSCSASN